MGKRYFVVEQHVTRFDRVCVKANNRAEAEDIAFINYDAVDPSKDVEWRECEWEERVDGCRTLTQREYEAEVGR